MKKSDLKYLNALSDQMIVSSIQATYPPTFHFFQFKIYHHELKEGLKRDRLHSEILELAINHFKSLGFMVEDHPQFGMMRLTLDIQKAVFSPTQATLFNERCKDKKNAQD